MSLNLLRLTTNVSRNSSRFVRSIHRAPPRRPPSEPSSLNSSTRGLVSHLLAGVLGGSLVIVAGYTWYHFSPLRQVVETTKRTKAYVEEAKQSLSKRLPTRAAEYLRKISKAYVAGIPGAEILVDSAFDSLEEVAEANSEEANAMANKTLEEIQRIVDNNKEGPQAALELMAVLRQRLGELQAYGTRVRAPLLNKVPAAKEKLGEGLEELRALAGRFGSKGKTAVDDTYSEAGK
ncbi:hypothetical protein FPV67DRAFT_1779711 [Lyophyllum atratum]|nr:hypothetical protein FPV67DRAFT_1779711 [Lyophyllum atratum]